MDQSRVKLVGAIVMALSIHSIWQTRSSSVMAEGSKSSESGASTKSSKRSAPTESSKTSASKEWQQQQDKEELENILLPSSGGSQSTVPRSGSGSDAGPVGGSTPPVGGSDPVGDDVVNGAAPSDSTAPAPDSARAPNGSARADESASGANGSTPPAVGSGATDGAVATDGMGADTGGTGAVTGSVSKDSDSAWPGEDDDADAVAPTAPVDAKSPPPLSAVIEKDDGKIELKSQRPLTDAEKNRQLIGEAIAKFGSPGLFMVSYMNGPWTIQNTLKSSSGERSGLKPGDTIISIDGRYITGMKIRDVYFAATGYRGQYRQFVINRDGFIKTISVPLWGINDMKDRRTQYIEYYWYLLYHNLISVSAYNRAVEPFLYFKVPKFKPMPTGK